MNFFIKPDGTFIKFKDAHWVWMEKNLHRVDPELDAKVNSSNMGEIYKAGWWRGSVSPVEDGFGIYLETERKPSKQTVIDTVFDVMSAFNYPPKKFQVVTIDYNAGRKSDSYDREELLGESFMEMVYKRLGESMPCVASKSTWPG